MSMVWKNNLESNAFKTKKVQVAVKDATPQTVESRAKRNVFHQLSNQNVSF